MDHASKLQTSKGGSSVTNGAAQRERELIDQRDAVLGSEPNLCGRALADRLGVSEAQLLMLDRGGSVRFLRAEWPEVLGKVRGLGTVMAFTRNDCVLHEKIGRYGEVIVDSGKALAVGEEINLRLFLDRWRYGFAVREGILNSLQFFDRWRHAVHKVYLLHDSDPRAFEELVESFERSQDDLVPAIERPAIIPAKGSTDFTLQSFRVEWDAQRDPPEFAHLLARYDLRHIDAFRLGGDERGWRLSASAFGRALAISAERAVPIILQIESGGAVQMHAGTVINVSSNGRWLNVIDPTFNFHFLEEAIVETWAVIRPTFDGPALSLEAIDLAGNSVASIFGAMHRECGTDKAWSAIVTSL